MDNKTKTGTIIGGSIIAGVAAVTLVAGTATAAVVFAGHQNNGQENNSSSHMGAGNGNGNGNNNMNQRGNDRQGNQNNKMQGRKQNNGRQNQNNENHMKNSNGNGNMGKIDLTNVPMGTLSDAQKAQLSDMAEEEKLAHDVYVTLGNMFPDVNQFANIQKAETTHLDAVKTLLSRYSMPDPTANTQVGTFTSEKFQTLYNSLVASAVSADTAKAAGVTVEKTDIKDLETAKSTVTAPDVAKVYTQLLEGSQRHLQAFSR